MWSPPHGATPLCSPPLRCFFLTLAFISLAFSLRWWYGVVLVVPSACFVIGYLYFEFTTAGNFTSY